MLTYYSTVSGRLQGVLISVCLHFADIETSVVSVLHVVCQPNTMISLNFTKKKVRICIIRKIRVKNIHNIQDGDR